MPGWGRRRFGSAFVAGGLGLWRAAPAGAEEKAEGTLTDVAGLKVGHFTDPRFF